MNSIVNKTDYMLNIKIVLDSIGDLIEYLEAKEIEI